jgi:alkylation response protein AidB-like acyl-CoA dehydrogenase
VDFALSQIQTMLQSAAKELLDKELPKARVLEIDNSPSGFAPDLWRKMCELGWSAMAIPEDYGGSGNSLTDVGALYEVLGYYACPSPHLSSAVLCAQAILEAGDAAQKRSLLPAIANGEQVFAMAFTEPDYQWGARGVQMRATRRGSDYVLSGTKLFVPDANVADRLVVAARTSSAGSPEQGVSLFVVDAKARGVSVRVMSGWLGPKMCEVTLQNVAVPVSAMLGGDGTAWPGLEKAMDRATAVLCAFIAGGSNKVYELARDYSQSRIAFGVPIGTFQRVQDRVIDALNEADAARWTAYEALWALDEGRPEAPIHVSTAKAVASVGFPKACDASHHVHGGIGTDLEYGLTQYTKRARTLQSYLGDAIYHRARIARLLEAKGAVAP